MNNSLENLIKQDIRRYQRYEYQSLIEGMKHANLQDKMEDE